MGNNATKGGQDFMVRTRLKAVESQHSHSILILVLVIIVITVMSLVVHIYTLDQTKPKVVINNGKAAGEVRLTILPPEESQKTVGDAHG